jgi:HK97 family phage prohead protease
MTEIIAPQFEMKRIFVPIEGFEIKMEGADKGTVAGLGCAYGNVDQGSDRMHMGCFAEDLAEHEKTGAVPHMFYNHKSDEPVGDWNRMKDTAKGLHMEGKFWLGQGIAKAEQAYNVAKSKGPKGFSVGFLLPKDGATYDAKEGVRNITKGRLKEVSIVPHPMNVKAMITSVKSILADKDHLSIREAEEILRDVALFSVDESKTFLARLFKGFELKLARDAEELKGQEALNAMVASLTHLNKSLMQG